MSDATTLDLIGWPLLPTNPDKTPRVNNWPNYRMTVEDLGKAGTGEIGCGVKLGGETGFIDIEGDGPTAEAEWQRITAGLDVPKTCSWRSARGVHRLFTLTPETRALVGVGSFKIGELEIRMGNPDTPTHYSLVPPVSGRVWVNDPLDFPVQELPLSVAHQINAERLTQDFKYPEDNDDHTIDPDQPGSIFNERTTWEELLLADGWTPCGSSGSIKRWTRPGKSEPTPSATTGHDDKDKLYVFSTSIDDLEAGKYYNRYAYYAFTRHGGDFRAAAADLAAQGFAPDPGDAASHFDNLPTPPEEYEDEDDEDAAVDLEERAQIEPDDIVLPGFVEKFVRLVEGRAHRSDPVLSATVALSALSCVMGRCVTGPDGDTRPNLGVLLLGKSGCGKSEAVHTLQKVFLRAGLLDNLHENFKSKEAFEDTLALPGNENMLVVQEEAHAKIDAINRNQGSHQAQLFTRLQEALTCSSTFLRTRSGIAGANGGVGRVIVEPNVSLLLTGISRLVWDVITPEMLYGGMLGRLMVIELGELKPCNMHVHEDAELMEQVVDEVMRWRELRERTVIERPGEDAGVDCTPVTLEATPESRKLHIEFTEEIERNTIEASRTESDSESAWNRARELFAKLELLAAGSRDPSNLKVTALDTIRASHLCRKLVRVKANNIDKVRQFDPIIVKATGAIRRFLSRRAEEGKYVFRRKPILQGTRVSASLLNQVVFATREQNVFHTDAKFRPDGSGLAMQCTRMCLWEHRKHLKIAGVKKRSKTS